MKLLTVIGARPQFIKAAAVGYAITEKQAAGENVQSIIVHTGQHYDSAMSQVFFDELGLQRPDYDLCIGSGSHGAQTGRMLEALDSLLRSERPDVVLVYGDTNSTLAGALAAAKLHFRVAHVEAGLRSYNRRMPEELNRVLTDHLARWLFCPTAEAVENLQREGITSGVHAVGDVMYELVTKAADQSSLPGSWGARSIREGEYVLATVHRAENTDNPARLVSIMTALVEISKQRRVVMPIHPRTEAALRESQISVPDSIAIVPPISYREMIAAQSGAIAVITDSGGVQKEAYWLGVPCVTVRDETEWSDTLLDGRNILSGSDTEAIRLAAIRQIERPKLSRPLVERNAAASLILTTLLLEGRLAQ